jgi:hypothetical protein
MLLAREAVPVVDAVERIGGLQAQEPKPPFIGLWSRLEGLERSDLLAAVRAGEVVRATLMRGTLHLVSTADDAALRPALAPSLHEIPLRIVAQRAKGFDPGRP